MNNYIKERIKTLEPVKESNHEYYLLMDMPFVGDIQLYKTVGAKIERETVTKDWNCDGDIYQVTGAYFDRIENGEYERRSFLRMGEIREMLKVEVTDFDMVIDNTECRILKKVKEGIIIQYWYGAIELHRLELEEEDEGEKGLLELIEEDIERFNIY